MIRFVVFDLVSGAILRSGICSPPAFNLQSLRANEATLEVDAAMWPVTDLTHTVDVNSLELVTID